MEVLFVVVRGRGGVTNVEERENDKRATPHGTFSGSSEFESALRVLVTRSSCGIQKDTSSATNTTHVPPLFLLHFARSPSV